MSTLRLGHQTQEESTVISQSTAVPVTARLAPFFTSDLEVVNYALTLEHLENHFYKMVNSSGLLQDDAASYFMVIGAHEQAHVDALTAVVRHLGGTPAEEQSSYNFATLGDTTTPEGILAIAEMLEHTGVMAYNGAGPEIMDKSLLANAGAIVNVEARHLAIIRVLIDPNANPVPQAFEEAATPQEILDLIQPILG
jgi:rubrerythrin